MEILAEHLGNPIPIEDEPGLMTGFARMVRERLPAAYLSERMSAIACDFDVDDNTRVTLEMWRSAEGDRVFEAKLQDQTDNWLGEGIIYQRERVYGVNLVEMTAHYQVLQECYIGQLPEGWQAAEGDEEESAFTTAHLAEITWILERIPKISHVSGENA